MRGEVKTILKGQELRQKLLRGSQQVREAVADTYGSKSGLVGIEKNYGLPHLTKDGVTVAREVILRDKFEDLAAGNLAEASEKTNKVSGDATTATVILGDAIFQRASQREVAGYNSAGLNRGIEKASLYIDKQLNQLSRPVTDEELPKVAGISATDPEIGKLVADTVEKVGGIGITIETYEGLGVKQEVVDGLYFEKGWTMPHFITDRDTEEVVHDNITVIAVEKRIKQNQDIVPIIESIHANTEHKTVLFIGNITGQALETCALTNLQGKVKVCVVNPPVYGDQELPFLEDVATMTGGKVVPSNLPSDKIDETYFGQADKAVVTKGTTTIYGSKGAKEDVDSRIEAINKQLKSDKYTAFQKERMELRLAKLNGKIAVIKVGGTSEAEAKEVKDRVDDALHTTKNAKEYGVLTGGATVLARLSTAQPKEMSNLSESELEGFKLTIKALAEPFKELMKSSGEDGGYRLGKLLESPDKYGFDLSDITIEPINLEERGILDATRAIQSAVENACGYARLMIRVKRHITIDREWQLEQLEMNRAQMR